MAQKVLIVDDSSLNRLAIKSYFSQLNYEVVGLAESVDQAKTMFDEHAPDVVTIDQIMPGQNGVVLAKYINGKDAMKGKKTIIVFITGDPLRESTKSTIKADHYILKPITKEKIETALG